MIAIRDPFPRFRCAAVLLFGAAALVAQAAEPSAPPIIAGVEAQPLAAQVQRLLEAADALGAPLPAGDQQALAAPLRSPEGAGTAELIQRVLDPHCLLVVNINPESRVKVAVGPAKPELLEQGWRVFLVKVHNEAGVTAELRATSPHARKVAGSPQDEVAQRWLELEMVNRQPLKKELSGLGLEYRLIQLLSRDAGKREAKIALNVGQGTQDIGFRNDADILFDSLPASEVTFHVKDEKGAPATASFIIRDAQGHVYPSQAKRLAPDFAFHPQVYRADGEKVRLPRGEYTVEFTRGPEYIVRTQPVTVKGKAASASFALERWIDPSTLGWWSGDHHIHAAGCAHYEKPTEGVHAPDMMRHCLGEDLKVGCNLTWGPCFDYQKQFFTGGVDKVSRYPYLLRYDVEVSGFGSHESGHLCLLRLREQMYPGGTSKNHWPKLCLNTLRWAKRQGAVVGPAHSGWGLEVQTDELPNYVVPPFSGIGANEYIVDVTHVAPGPEGKPEPAVDFLSMVDTPYVWELNMWYHTLNVGYRTRISGETDFPCIYGERVGLGRSYVKLEGKLDYDAWCEGIRQGRNYVGDGKSHLLEFRLNDTPMGVRGSEVRLSQPGTARVTVKAAAFLNEQQDASMQHLRYDQKPYWHIERARIRDTREVPVELVVNGYPVAKQDLLADGQLRELSFEVKLERSSWVALRILPSSHTNPIFVEVGGKPIRASRRSAEWCLKGVDQCWSQKERFIKGDEIEQAKAAYEHARQTYTRLVAESEVE
jgi:hypothetical protein